MKPELLIAPIKSPSCGLLLMNDVDLKSKFSNFDSFLNHILFNKHICFKLFPACFL